MDKLFIKTLIIHNFRALKDITLNFNEKYNLIEGANGTGKSSILDAIRYIFCHKNINGKTPDNYKSIHDDNALPHIELIFSFKNKDVLLKVKKGKWFVNNHEFANVSSYSSRICEILNIDSIDELFVRSNPHHLIDIVTKNTGCTKEFKDEFISIMNIGLPEGSKIDNFSELVEQKNAIKEEMVGIQKRIKELTSEKNNYVNAHSEIKCWDIIVDDKEYLDKLEEIESKIQKYEQVSDELKSKSNELNQTQTKINLLLSEINDISNVKNIPQNNTNKKIPSWLIFILSLLTLSIFYWIYKWFQSKKNKNINTQNTNIDNESITNKQYEIKELQSKMDEIKQAINKLENDDNYKDIDYQNLINLRTEIRNEKDDNISLNRYKLKYKSLLKEIENETKKQKAKNSEAQKIEVAYKNAIENIEKHIKRHFKEFDIDLFDEKGSDKFLISQNGVSIKDLNFAHKNNIVHMLNQFIKQGIKIDCFNLIDQVESFNSLSLAKTDSQVIGCKVSNSRALRLNGTDIN